MVKTKVGLLYGGRSVEHEISIRSAHNIEAHIDKTKFEVLPIGICKKGLWRHTGCVDKAIDKGQALALRLDPSNPCFLVSSGEPFSLDVMLSILHGTHGEDGSVQGLLNTMGIPIVGSGVLGSAIAMNKLVSKHLLLQARLPVAKFLYYHSDEWQKIRFATIRSKLGLPFMVKAVNLGSSIGVSYVNKEADLAGALAHAFHYDEAVIIEEYISGREIECAVLGNNPPKASVPGEVIIGKNYDFYTFDAKYMDPEAVQINVPAILDKPDIARIQTLAVSAFKTLHCSDFARVDLFLGDDGHCYINEVNTLPGFTDASMFPLMCIDKNVSFGTLITNIIQLALQRHANSSHIKKEFKSTGQDNNTQQNQR